MSKKDEPYCEKFLITCKQCGSNDIEIYRCHETEDSPEGLGVYCNYCDSAVMF